MIRKKIAHSLTSLMLAGSLVISGALAMPEPAQGIDASTVQSKAAIVRSKNLSSTPNKDSSSVQSVNQNTMQTITDQDREEAKQVITHYFKELETSKTVLLSDLGYTMPYYRSLGACSINNGANSILGYIFNDGFKPKFIKFGDGPKFENSAKDTITRYKQLFGMDIYKVMSIHVYLDFYGAEDWDFVMVKTSETSPWKIDIWYDEWTPKK